MKRFLSVVALVTLALAALRFGEELRQVASPPSAVWSRPVPVATMGFNTQAAAVSLSGGEYLLAWPAGSAVRFALLSADGRPQRQGQVTAGGPVGEVTAGRPGQAEFYWSGPDASGGAELDPTTGEVVARHSLPAAGALASAGEWLFLARETTVEAYRLAGGKPQRRAAFPLPGVTLLAAASDGRRTRLLMAQETRSEVLSFWESVWSSPDGPPAKPAFGGLVRTPGGAVTSLATGFDRSRVYRFMTQETFGARRRSTLLLAVTDLPDTASPAPAQPPALEWRRLPASLAGLPGLTQVTSLSLGVSGGDRLLAAATGRITRRHGTEYQAFTAEAGPDGLVSPRFASRAKGAALRASLALPGERLLAYTESAGFDRYRLSVAGTGPAFLEHNRLTSGDLLNALAGTLLSLSSTVLALYYLPATLFLALAALTLVSALALTWSEQHSREMLALGLTVYLAGKTLLLPRTFYEPAARLLLPEWLTPLPVGLLLSTFFFAVGAWGALTHAGGRKRFSPFSALLVAAAVDLPLTLWLFTPYLR